MMFIRRINATAAVAIGRGAVLCFFVVMICVSALAGQLNGDGGRHFFLLETFKLEGGHNSQSFFLFAQGEVSNHTGDLVVLGGNITVAGNFQGDVYSFFANMRLDSVNSLQSGTIHSISSKITAGYSSMDIKPLAGDYDYFYKAYHVPTGMIYDNTIPQFWMHILTGLFSIILSLILLPVKRSFFEQSGLALLNQPIRVLRNGIITYFTLLMSAVIFALSIVGFPVSAAILLVTFFISLVGQISVSYALGGLCLRSLRSRRKDAYSNVAVGVIMIQVFKFLPSMRWLTDFLLIPLFAAGTIVTGIVNGLLIKRFFDAPGDSAPANRSNSNDNLRRIILGE